MTAISNECGVTTKYVITKMGSKKHMRHMKIEERKKGKWVLIDSNDKIIVITSDKKIINGIISKHSRKR